MPSKGFVHFFSIYFSKAILIIIVIINISCSSSIVKISSTPSKADIFIRRLSDSTMKKIGVTPLTIRSDQVASDLDGSGPMYLELRKDEHYSKSAIVTDFNVRDIELNLKLDPKKFLKDSNKIDALINGLFNCQKLIRKRNYKEAKDTLTKLKNDFPYISVIYEFEGGIHLVEQQYSQALESFKTAIKFNPSNVEALRLKRAVEKQFNLAGNKE